MKLISLMIFIKYLILQMQLQPEINEENRYGTIVKYDPENSTMQADAVSVQFSFGDVHDIQIIKQLYPKLKQYINTYGIYQVQTMEDIATISTLQKIHILLDRDIKKPIIKILTSKMKELKTICMGNSGLEDHDVKLICSNFPRLKCLWLENNIISIDALQLICQHNKQLEQLNFSWIDIGVYGAQLIASNLKQMRKLLLKQCYVKEEGLNLLFTSLTHLEDLDVWFNQICGEGLKNVSQSMKVLGLQHNPNLKLSQCIIPFRPGLIELRLQNTSTSDQSIKNICESFPNLKSLNLESNNITNEGVKILGKKCIALENLNLSNNKNITDGGLSYLSKFKHLKQLSVQQCGYSCCGIVKIRRFAQLQILGIQMVYEFQETTIMIPIPVSIQLKLFKNNKALTEIRTTNSYQQNDKKSRNVKLLTERRNRKDLKKK